ncbi:uncharacterized protein [Lolium perenne]|uniref:uncharacterized protein isoform X2 n=1 Tax=Lolium perenne TaxID=4522 RepID=UPI0021F53707|nr:uncharacterized protein LOC127294091 isoform X2 [Lolium perenne]
MLRRSSRNPSRSSRSQVFVDLDSDDSDGEECKSKRSRPSRRETVETSESPQNVLPSCGDDLLPKRSSKRITNSRMAKTNTNKVLWKRIDEDKKSAYAYFDSLWFNMYNSGNNKSNVLKWIKAKKIFLKKYVFVPIVCWGHWNLLVLFNFGETNYSDTKKKPRMLLLDSLKTTNPIKLRSAIERLVVDILKTEERQDSEQFINEVHLEFPEVPQQTGDECGIYVLFFIYCFLLNEKLGEDFSQLSKDVMFNSEELEKFQKDIDSFQANRNVLPSCKPSFDDDDHLSERSSKHIANSRRGKTKEDKFDTDIFELYMEDLWKRIDEDKKSAYAYFDSIWFYMYKSGDNKPNILKWIKAKKIFSRQYVFVPIVCWGHWNLLVLCNFGETNYSDTKKKPRMLLLDSLKTTDLANLPSTIKRFIVDILKSEERPDIEQFINEVHLEFPEVPRQTGDDSGIYVLFFIHCFLQNEKPGEDFSQLPKDVMFNSEELGNFQKDIGSFRANRNTEVED